MIQYIFDFLVIVNTGLSVYTLLKHKDTPATINTLASEIKANIKTSETKINKKLDEHESKLTFIKPHFQWHAQSLLHDEHEHDGRPSNIWKG